MHRLAVVLTCLASCALLLLPSCCCPSGLEEANQCNWVLTCVEIDQSLMRNAGTLPIYYRRDGYSFGREPVAMGTMQGSRDGLWSISIKFKEPVVAFSGRSGVHEYDVLTVSGKWNEKQEKIIAQGAFPDVVATGVATEVHVVRVSETKMKLRPATRGRVLPYVFTFDSTPPQPRPVSIPLL
jgi:hypothetical protein